MKPVDVLPWLSLAIMLVSLAVSLAAYARSGRWKDGEDATRLIDRVGRCETAITTLNAQMSNVATKEDMAGIRAEVAALGGDIRSTERGVERIEGFLMKERA